MPYMLFATCFFILLIFIENCSTSVYIKHVWWLITFHYFHCFHTHLHLLQELPSLRFRPYYPSMISLQHGGQNDSPYM